MQVVRLDQADPAQFPGLDRLPDEPDVRMGHVVLGEGVGRGRPVRRRDEPRSFRGVHARRRLGQHMHPAVQERDGQGRVLIEVVGQDDPVKTVLQQLLPLFHQHRTGQPRPCQGAAFGVAVTYRHDLQAHLAAPLRQVKPHPESDHSSPHTGIIQGTALSSQLVFDHADATETGTDRGIAGRTGGGSASGPDHHRAPRRPAFTD